MTKLLLITPPFVQPNTPYPATAYLKGYLTRCGIEVEQVDLSVELLSKIFSEKFITQLFEQSPSEFDDPNIEHIYAIRRRYVSTVEMVMRFLRGEDSTLANRICLPDTVPQASRFSEMGDLSYVFGAMGVQDCAKHICTLYLQDLSDFIRATVSEHFEIVRYAEQLSIAVPSFDYLEEELREPLNPIEELMLELLEGHLTEQTPEFVGFTIPFPGNLFSALRCAEYIKQNHANITTIAGGGYPTTELRTMSDKGIFSYFDYIVLDAGERSIANIVEGKEASNIYTKEGYIEPSEADERAISHGERGCPDFSGLPFDKYFSLCEVTNSMHRLWSDGRWNKMTIAYGCYWGKCAFCDTTLDYVKCYSGVTASQFVDWMEQVAEQTGSTGFHFTDEAAPPKLLKEISLELIRRELNFTWWTNIRFESAFTEDVCHLMAAAGCIAVSGGLEVASDRLLKLINKGISIETATIVMRNFYYSGILVHSYLMYGFPTQTLQETVDSLEVVRQLFRAELIDSAFWHRFSMTEHSETGHNPSKFKIERVEKELNPFANNLVEFEEKRSYDIDNVGDGLNHSLINYMVGSGIDRRADRWFEGRIPRTKVENTLITDHLIKPDASRLYNEQSRLVWIGASLPTKSSEGVLFNNLQGQDELRLESADADFVVELIKRCSNLKERFTLTAAKKLFEEQSDKSFLNFYHSKRWDKIRTFGLLQI